jgi:hypothetical protein
MTHNYCLHRYTITILARVCLQSLIARLHCWLSTLCVVGLRFFGSTHSSLADYWLLSSPAGSLTDSTLRSSCLKVGMCGRYSEHLVPRFVSALWRVGYWGSVCCVFTVHRSLWLTVAGISGVVYIRYLGYIASPLSGNGTEFREIGCTGSRDDIFGCWIAVTICVSGARHNIMNKQSQSVETEASPIWLVPTMNSS